MLNPLDWANYPGDLLRGLLAGQPGSLMSSGELISGIVPEEDQGLFANALRMGTNIATDPLTYAGAGAGMLGNMFGKRALGSLNAAEGLGYTGANAINPLARSGKFLDDARMGFGDPYYAGLAGIEGRAMGLADDLPTSGYDPMTQMAPRDIAKMTGVMGKDDFIFGPQDPGFMPGPVPSMAGTNGVAEQLGPAWGQLMGRNPAMKNIDLLGEQGNSLTGPGLAEGFQTPLMAARRAAGPTGQQNVLNMVPGQEVDPYSLTRELGISDALASGAIPGRSGRTRGMSFEGLGQAVQPAYQAENDARMLGQLHDFGTNYNRGQSSDYMAGLLLGLSMGTGGGEFLGR